MQIIKARQYFQLSFLLPPFFSIVGMLYLLLTEYFNVGISLGDTIGWIFTFLAYSIIIGGVQYAIIIIAFLWWMKNMDLKSIKRLILILPIIHALSMAFSSILGARTAEVLDYMGYSLLFGYFYVAIAFTGYFILSRKNILEEI